ncbi:hypothetical protein FBU31_005869, partial [Coemansia sp. 'formosensis']
SHNDARRRRLGANWDTKGRGPDSARRAGCCWLRVPGHRAEPDRVYRRSSRL